MNHVTTLANALARSGMEVTVFALGSSARSSTLLDPSVEFRAVAAAGPAPGGRGYVGAGRRLRRVLASRGWDWVYVIHSWTIPSFLIATRGRPRWPGSRTAYHTFDWLEPGLVPPWAIWLERYVARRCDLVVNVDRARGRLMRTLYRLRETPLWLPNYPSLAEPPGVRDLALRRSLLGDDPPDDAVLLVYPSLATPARMTRELLGAFALLPRRYRLVTFAREGEYAVECRRLAGAVALKGRVTFCDPVPFEELKRYLACADVGAILHDIDGSSGYFMANPDRLGGYVLHSVPFVASAVPNLESVVYRYCLGACCDPRDSGAIAAAIRNVVEGPPGLDARRRAVHEAFRNELNIERHLGRLLKRLRPLSGGPRAGRTWPPAADRLGAGGGGAAGR